MKRKWRNPQGFRKRHNQSNGGHVSPLQAVAAQIQRREFEGALRDLDRQLVGNPSPLERGRVLALVGDALFKQGKFVQARGAYARAGQMPAGGAELSARSGYGEIRSLIRQGRGPEARDRGAAIVSAAADFETEYRIQMRKVAANLSGPTPVVVSAVPPRASVVASRIGQFLVQGGDLDGGRSFFESAIKLNPQGASRARLGLAEIALREGNFGRAMELGQSAILVGQFRAKTLSAWPLLLAAAAGSKTDFVELGFWRRLAEAKPSVRARARLLILRAMRARGDSRWQSLANTWLQEDQDRHPVAAAETRKLLLAQAKAGHSVAGERGQTARALLDTPSLGPKEWLAGLKAEARAEIDAGRTPDFEQRIARGIALYGAEAGSFLIHGLALACREGRPEIALTLLQRNIDHQAPSSLQWGRSLWAKARVYKSLGRPSEAAQAYWSFYQQSGQPQRLRLYALLEWTRALVGGKQALATVTAQLQSVIPQLTDFELTLDLARQVRCSALEPSLADKIFEQGRMLAMQNFDVAIHPSAAVSILFKLCRRANDFTRYDVMIDTWTRLSPDKKKWLWSTKSDFWMWLEHVFRAYRDSGKLDEADFLLSGFLSDPSTPPEGYAILGISIAASKRDQKDMSGAMAIYEKMAQIAPSYEWTSVAYYWLALRSWVSGDRVQACHFGERILVCVGNDRGMYWKEEMHVSAMCIQARLDRSMFPANSGISVERFTNQLKVIGDDMARLFPGKTR